MLEITLNGVRKMKDKNKIEREKALQWITKQLHWERTLANIRGQELPIFYTTKKD